MDKRSSKRCKVARRFFTRNSTYKVGERKQRKVIVDIIENFANLPKSDSVSINVQACGHEWKVRVYLRAGIILLDMTMAVMSSFCLVVMVKELKTR